MAITLTHVDINREIKDWQKAIYGREVRAANVSALTKLQDQANGAMDYITEKGVEIDTVRADVEQVRQNAQASVDHANDITAEYKQYADDKLAETESERQAAEAAKEGADQAAVLAKSWATGGTSTRTGEDGDNSRYYSELSKSEADRATTEADRASQYASIVAPGFYVNLDTMELYMKAGVGVDFLVVDGNILCWKVA